MSRRHVSQAVLTFLLLGVAAGSVAAQDPAGDRYALLIGVRKYRDDSGLTELKFPEKDVTALATLLRDNGYRTVRVLTQADASNDRNLPRAENIRRELELILDNKKPSDTVLLAFAGHGVQFRDEPTEAWFCPMDANLNDRRTLVSLGEVYRRLEDCQAGGKVLIADACRNDPVDRGSRNASRVQSLSRPQKIAPPGGVVALFSCTAGQSAFERPELGHGVFFHFLLEGLRDGKVEVLDLAAHVNKQVYDYVSDHIGEKQTPELVGKVRRGLPLLAAGRTVVKKASLPPEPPPQITKFDQQPSTPVPGSRTGPRVESTAADLTGAKHFHFLTNGSFRALLGDTRWALVVDGGTGREITPRLRQTRAQYGTTIELDVPTDYSAVQHSVFSPDGRRVATAHDGRLAMLWDATSGKPLTPPLRHQQGVLHVAFSPDSQRVVTASSDHTARVWDARTGQPVTPPLRHQDEVWRAVFSSDGRRVVTASKDCTAQVWDASTGQRIGDLLRHEGWVDRAVFSPDGRRVVTASHDHTARVWDATTGQPVTPPLSHKDLGQPVHPVLFSPDSRKVVTGSSDGTARIWDAATGALLFAPLKHGSTVYDLAFSPDGRQLATASYDGTARVWDTSTGLPLTGALKHTSMVFNVAFSPDGKQLATYDGDLICRLWDIESGQVESQVKVP